MDYKLVINWVVFLVVHIFLLLVLRYEHHHEDPQEHGQHLHHALLEGGPLQQLGDDGDGGDVDEAAGSEGKDEEGGGVTGALQEQGEEGAWKIKTFRIFYLLLKISVH